MLIGVDFDNTLIDYEDVFAPAAVEMGLLPSGFSGGKTAVRDAIRAGSLGDEGWMRLQGRVYGGLIARARPFAGARDFLAARHAVGDRLVLVSHKTEFGHFDPDRVPLRDAARGWLADNGFLDTEVTGLGGEVLWFEPTREAKIARIAALGCDHFIDDLPEVLLDPAFPADTTPWLFAPGGTGPGVMGPGGADAAALVPHRSWEALAHAFPV